MTSSKKSGIAAKVLHKLTVLAQTGSDAELRKQLDALTVRCRRCVHSVNIYATCATRRCC
jgi:hypothetical protein